MDGTVRAVPVFGSGGSSLKRGFSVFQYSLARKNGSGSVPVPLSVSGRTVPVSGSSSVPEPPWFFYSPIFRDGETTIKIKFPLFEGWGALGQRGKSSKTLFFVGNATTIKF